MIKYKDFSCGYKEKTLFCIKELEVASDLCILGANGSGKSTLAKATCQLIEYQGDIFYESEKLKSINQRSLAKLISYIPPKLESFDEYITVKEFVLLGRYVYKDFFGDYTKEDRKRVNEVLEELNIAYLKNSSLKALSSGESQLVLFAQSLVQDSKIIIFDEPTANLDPKNSKIIATVIKKLQKNFNCMVITHDLALASFLNSSILFIKDKQTHFYQKPSEFFKDSELQKLYEVDFKNMVLVYE